MAEVVEYRVEKTIDELNLLVEFKLFSKEHAKEIISKREKFEYVLRRRNRTKLDFLKYIRFEVNLLESIEKYKKSVLGECSANKTTDKIEEIERKILLLQAKKLNDILRSRSAHISSLFRKLTTTFQFDKKLWLAYIDFAKGRNWNSRVTSLYWRLLRVSSSDPNIWIAAANHEVEVNKAYDTARGLFLRALRHHPRSANVWAEYFKMEVRFMEIVDQRARIVFRVTNEAKENKKDADIWADSVADDDELHNNEDDKDNEQNQLPEVKPIDKDDAIISGHLPKVIYNNAVETLKDKEEFSSFLVLILMHILPLDPETKGLQSIEEHIFADIDKMNSEKDARISNEFAKSCRCLDYLKGYVAGIDDGDEQPQSIHSKKRPKKDVQSNMNLLYDCYEAKGVDETRIMFNNLEKSVKNQTLSLYVGMIQIELWRLANDKSECQLERIRSIYEKALSKFGKVKPKLWYEYLQFEYDNSKSLEDFTRVNQLYTRSKLTLHPSKVDRVIEKYTLLQVNSSSADIEYSDYSDLDD